MNFIFFDLSSFWHWPLNLFWKLLTPTSFLDLPIIVLVFLRLTVLFVVVVAVVIFFSNFFLSLGVFFFPSEFWYFVYFILWILYAFSFVNISLSQVSFMCFIPACILLVLPFFPKCQFHISSRFLVEYPTSYMMPEIKNFFLFETCLLSMDFMLGLVL